MKPHLFVPDPDIGPGHDGRHTCAVCRMRLGSLCTESIKERPR